MTASNQLPQTLQMTVANDMEIQPKDVRDRVAAARDATLDEPEDLPRLPAFPSLQNINQPTSPAFAPEPGLGFTFNLGAFRSRKKASMESDFTSFEDAFNEMRSLTAIARKPDAPADIGSKMETSSRKLSELLQSLATNVRGQPLMQERLRQYAEGAETLLKHASAAVPKVNFEQLAKLIEALVKRLSPQGKAPMVS